MSETTGGTRVDGAVAVVTGGQRGLGRSIVDALLARGATKVYSTSRRPDTASDPRIAVVEADVTDDASVHTLAGLAQDATIVVNNAGLLGGQSLLRSDFDEIRSVFETNLFGALRVTEPSLPSWPPTETQPSPTWRRCCRGYPDMAPTDRRRQHCGRRRIRCERS